MMYIMLIDRKSELERGEKMITANIKAYLENNGIKQSFLSEKTGIPTTTLNATLNGNRKIQIEEYFSICEALNVKLTAQV